MLGGGAGGGGGRPREGWRGGQVAESHWKDALKR